MKSSMSNFIYITIILLGARQYGNRLISNRAILHAVQSIILQKKIFKNIVEKKIFKKSYEIQADGVVLH